MLHLPEIKEKTKVLSKINGILGFLNFLYLSQVIQHIFFILTFLESVDNILKLLCNSFHIR